MTRLTGSRQASSKRLVLGYDGGCSACGELARRIDEELSGKIEVLSLYEPQVEEWRKKALGKDAPLVPTLFEVRVGQGEQREVVRAWTGWRLGANLCRFLRPADTWRVMQALDEFANAPTTGGRSVGGVTRGQFLKGVGGTAVTLSLLSATGKPAWAQSTPSTTAPGSLKRTGEETVGASISHPAEWLVEREQYTLDGTYGFTMWKPAPDSSSDPDDSDDSEAHAETTPAVRVARVSGLRPGQIEQRVRARLEEYSDLSMNREEVRVGRKNLKGTAIGPIPGSTPSTEVYVSVEDRVYQINVYGEKLDGNGRKLLLDLEFSRPSRSIDSLGLPDGKKGETHQGRGDAGLVERERKAREEAAQTEDTAVGTMALSASSVPTYEEYKTSEGCWVAKSTYYFQTQHGMYANKRWGTAYTGWTIVGRPNYWGQYTHGNYGYGRCTSPYYTNDKFAVDYPLGKGDVLFSPFKNGTVTFAGRNYTHKDYGIFVVVKAENGKYVNLSAHLSGLASGIRRGASVTYASILGYAGDTGAPDIPVGEPHLHQAYYRYPRYNTDGSPYGGAGLQVVYHRYVGTAAGTGPGVYKFGWTSDSTTWAKGDWISN